MVVYQTCYHLLLTHHSLVRPSVLPLKKEKKKKLIFSFLVVFACVGMSIGFWAQVHFSGINLWYGQVPFVIENQQNTG